MSAQRDLVQQINLMNRVHAALSSSLKSDDVYVLILATLTAPSGLDFQRGMLFLFEPSTQRLRGHLAMGPATAEEAAERRAESEAEAAALRQIAAAMAADGGATESGESLLDLRHGAHWIDTIQRQNPDGGLTRRLRQAEQSAADAAAAKRASDAKPRLIDFLDERKPRRRLKSETRLPAFLEEELAEEFAILPLRAGGKPRGLVVADRRFASDEKLSDDRIESLEWFQTQTSLALDNAELYGALQRAYQDLKEIDKLKSNFLSTVSHELRTPLTAINGFVQLLADGRVGELTPTQKHLLDRVRLQGAHMANMVNDIIEMTEFQTGGLDEMDLEPVDPLGCLFNVMPKLEPRRREKNVTIEPQVGSAVPLLKANPRALERIYYHLLDNAVKFNEAGGRVDISFRSLEDGKRLSVDFKDTGVGIPSESLERIFGNFYQVDNNLTRSRNGMGLGLTMTKILLDATGGSIAVESSPGQGSVFSVSYPAWLEEVDGSAAAR
jgi:signal transduction histidine kinase